MNTNFRSLTKDEIEVRVNSINEKGCSLLLYKNARCDMNILDETVGKLNWKRTHTRDNANCIVSIYDDDKKEWISKEDTGTESYAEKEKGLASDSFKRACTNWGIGRELYTSPFIWIPAESVKIEPDKRNGKLTTKDRFKVKSVGIENGVITELTVVNTGQYGNKEKVVFTYPKRLPKPELRPEPKPEPEPEPNPNPDGQVLRGEDISALRSAVRNYNEFFGKKITEEQCCKSYNKKSFRECDKQEYTDLIGRLYGAIEKAKKQAEATQ